MPTTRNLGWALRGHCVSLAARLLGRTSYQDRLRLLIEQTVRGMSFVDVGCMWNVNGAYAFHALQNGASDVAGLDVRAATDEFVRTNAACGNRVRFIQGDINEDAVASALGRFDVVFCSGVLYHMPNPLLTLERLRALCGQVLILGSSIIPEMGVPQAAIYYPFLGDEWRRKFTYKTPGRTKVGLDTPFKPEWDYSNYFRGAHAELCRSHGANGAVHDCRKVRVAPRAVPGLSTLVSFTDPRGFGDAHARSRGWSR